METDWKCKCENTIHILMDFGIVGLWGYFVNFLDSKWINLYKL